MSIVNSLILISANYFHTLNHQKIRQYFSVYSIEDFCQCVLLLMPLLFPEYSEYVHIVTMEI